jgi:hypothetical protein
MRAAAAGILIALGLTSMHPTASTRGRTAAGVPGRIEGRVVFDGTPPPPTIVIQDGGFQPVLYVDRSGGVRYAVVFLPDARSGGLDLSMPAVMNQRDFIFVPQLLAVRAGQLVRFTNDDSANHNVRAQDANPANTFSISTAPGTIVPDSRRFAPTAIDRPLRLSCDIHPWMAAWIYVFDNERFVVTGGDGRFRIDNVPAGRHRVAIRQPSARLTRDLIVNIRSGEPTELDVRFTAADVRKPSG